MIARAPALLVGHAKALQASGGGVQVCNREYAAVLEAAGFSLHAVPYEFDAGIARRIANRLLRSRFEAPAPRDLSERIGAALNETGASVIFFAMNVYPDVSVRLREAFPQVPQVLLSLGLESLDLCVEARIVHTRWPPSVSAETRLGRQLLHEARQRRHVDGVLTLSPFEAGAEKWLGAAKSAWVPRTIFPRPLAFAPVDRRVGCVATLDHPPNRDGLSQLLDALSGQVAPAFRFRLAGQPAHLGQALARKYAYVEYVGAPDDDALRREAATWCCFVNPLFHFAKGCSTKLGVALSWELPTASTEAGARGYVWDTAIAPLAGNPSQLARMVIERSRLQRFGDFRAQTLRLVAAMPSVEAVARDVGDFVQGLHPNPAGAAGTALPHEGSVPA